MMSRAMPCFLMVVAFAIAVTNHASLDCLPRNLSCLVEFDAQASHQARCHRRLQIALVGAGLFATKAHIPALIQDNDDCFELRALWSLSYTSAMKGKDIVVKLKGRSYESMMILWGDAGWDELLRSGVEVLDIVLPIPDQLPYVKKALAHGISVISEKPIARSSSEVETMVAHIGSTTSPHWFVSENWRFESTYRIAAYAQRAGAIGKTISFAADSGGYMPEDNPMLQPGSWRIANTSNWIIDVCVHSVAAIRLALGGELVVQGVAAHRARSFILPFDTFSASLSLGTSGGVPGTWLFSLSAPRKSPKEVSGLKDMELQIIGTNGSLFATRGHIELRGFDGHVLERVDGFASLGVSSALRAAALVIQGEPRQQSSVAHELQPLQKLVSPMEALLDLKVIEEVVRRGISTLRTEGEPSSALHEHVDL